MDKLNMGKHISNKFNEELEAVRNRVLSMGGCRATIATIQIQTADVEQRKLIMTQGHKSKSK